MIFHEPRTKRMYQRLAYNVQKVIRIGDTVFNLISFILFWGLVALVVLWWFQNPTMLMTKVPSQDIVTLPGEPVYIDKDKGLSFNTDTTKAYYKMWLEDHKGSRVYQYPPVVLNDPTSISFGGRKIEIPSGLTAGDYKLMVFIKYDLNPVKTAETTLELAKVRVFDIRDGYEYRR